MAGKRTRANGEGSIYERKDSNGKTVGWRGQQYLGDKRKSYSGKTKQEVRNAMTTDLADYINGDFVEATDLTVKAWAEYWLENEKKPDVKEQTFRKIRSSFELHLFPVLGSLKLQDLTKEKIQKGYDIMFVKTKKPTGESYSASLVRQVTTNFNTCLKSAVIDGKLAKNPHDGVKIPKGRTPKEVDAYSRSEQDKLVDYFKRSSLQVDWLLYLLITTGMREGEAIALTWSDVDLKEKTIAVNKTLVYQDGFYQVQPEPKTQKSNRNISIPDNVVRFLKRVKKQIDQAKNTKGIVFPNTKYNYFQPDYIRRRFEKICAILDIPYYGVHSLRHTWSTRCLEMGIDVKKVSEYLGHKSITTTINIYQSVLKETQEDFVKMLNDMY